MAVAIALPAWQRFRAKEKFQQHQVEEGQVGRAVAAAALRLDSPPGQEIPFVEWSKELPASARAELKTRGTDPFGRSWGARRVGGESAPAMSAPKSD